MTLPTPANSFARRVLSSAALAAAVGVVWPAPAATQSKLPPIIQRASAYVAGFVNRFSNIVAEERYVQQTERPGRHRELLSDYLFVRPQGQMEWFEFRDVIEVDGKRIPEKDKRLLELLTHPPANLSARVREIAAESSRYNLEDIGTLDKPLVALAFLQPVYAERFAYVIGPYERNLGDSVRLVQFQEFARPTLMRSVASDLPARGRYWIDEVSGRVVKTTVEFRARTDFVTTTFRFDPDVQGDVPAEMTQQWYLGRTGSTRFSSTSTYSRFRQFNVQTEEKIR